MSVKITSVPDRVFVPTWSACTCSLISSFNDVAVTLNRFRNFLQYENACVIGLPIGDNERYDFDSFGIETINFIMPSDPIKENKPCYI